MQDDITQTIGIMPCLDMKEGRVVKGIHFVDLKDAGDPVENAQFYQKEGADELAMLDIAATLENRKTRLEWVKNVSAVIDIPLTVGGGISSLEDIELVIGAGADKFSMNSAAVANPDLVREAAKQFGTEKVTVAVDARRNKDMPSGFELVVSGGTKPVGKDAISWAKECQDLGAGVILPTSMDGDGTQAGFDLEFTKAVSDVVNVPVVASGGAGTLEHFYEAVVVGGAQVVLAASVFHYRLLSIGAVKEYLRGKGLQVNLWGTSLLAIVVISVSALLAHNRLANVDYKTGILLGIGGILGAQVGSRLVEHVSTANFRKIFAVILLGLAAYIFFKK